MPTPLSDHDVQQALSKIAYWNLKGTAIERVLEFPDFKTAMDFVHEIAEAAESVNHHPDIHISYKTVTLSLTSHDSGGVTNRDLNMATRINEIAKGSRH